MSLNNSLAITRPHPSRETFNKLAQSHLQHDLTAEDRDALTAAGRTFGLYTTIGSVVGLGLGLVLAIRVRQGRRQMLTALRMTDRPTHVKFMDGREEALPDLSPYLRPTRLGDIAAGMLFGAGGLFIGGETGLLTGSFSARRSLTADDDRRTRIERAFRSFRADVLRQQADFIDGKKGRDGEDGGDRGSGSGNGGGIGGEEVIWT